jgi:hypothetical protein
MMAMSYSQTFVMVEVCFVSQPQPATKELSGEEHHHSGKCQAIDSL